MHNLFPPPVFEDDEERRQQQGQQQSQPPTPAHFYSYQHMHSNDDPVTTSIDPWVYGSLNDESYHTTQHALHSSPDYLPTSWQQTTASNTSCPYIPSFIHPSNSPASLPTPLPSNTTTTQPSTSAIEDTCGTPAHQLYSSAFTPNYPIHPTSSPSSSSYGFHEPPQFPLPSNDTQINPNPAPVPAPHPSSFRHPSTNLHGQGPTAAALGLEADFTPATPLLFDHVDPSFQVAAHTADGPSSPSPSSEDSTNIVSIEEKQRDAAIAAYLQELQEIQKSRSAFESSAPVPTPAPAIDSSVSNHPNQHQHQYRQRQRQHQRQQQQSPLSISQTPDSAIAYDQTVWHHQQGATCNSGVESAPLSSTAGSSSIIDINSPAGFNSPLPTDPSLSASTCTPTTTAMTTTTTKHNSTPVTGGVEMVMDLKMNATVSLPRKHRPRTQEQRDRYIAVRNKGACEKHKKQHKRVGIFSFKK